MCGEKPIFAGPPGGPEEFVVVLSGTGDGSKQTLYRKSGLSSSFRGHSNVERNGGGDWKSICRSLSVKVPDNHKLFLLFYWRCKGHNWD